MKQSDSPPWGFFLAITGLIAVGASLLVLPGLLFAPAPTGGPTPPPTLAAVIRVTPPPAAVTVCQLIGGGNLHSIATVTGLAFPSGLTVTAGDQMTFENLDTRTHSVTLDNGACDTGPIAARASATLKFLVPGTYPFHCSVYPTMRGTVVVTPP